MLARVGSFSLASMLQLTEGEREGGGGRSEGEEGDVDK